MTETKSREGVQMTHRKAGRFGPRRSHSKLSSIPVTSVTGALQSIFAERALHATGGFKTGWAA